MAPPSANPPLPPAANPRSKQFDPWNSCSAGHQRAESSAGTGWRESRCRKLNSQFHARSTGGERLSDTWGAGSENYDERIKAIVPKTLKRRAQGRSVMDMLVRPGMMRESLPQKPKEQPVPDLPRDEALKEARRREDDEREVGGNRGIFDGVVVYVNGSTYPLVSDHRLKHILSENGGQLSLHLGRRRVTHVILGRPAGGGHGAGGGLAGGKLDKEIRKMGGCGVKFVGVEWVLESLKAGKRLPEARFANMTVAPSGQGSVYGLYSRQTTLTTQ